MSFSEKYGVTICVIFLLAIVVPFIRYHRDTMKNIKNGISSDTVVNQYNTNNTGHNINSKRHGKYDGSFMRGLNTVWDYVTVTICLLIAVAIICSWFN